MPDTGSKALPGLTDLLVLYRQAARARSRWLLTLALIFLRGMVNEIVPASSARFSCTDIRSRNRSPPVELSAQDSACGRQFAGPIAGGRIHPNGPRRIRRPRHGS